MKTVASFLYQWIVFVPLFLVLTLITALVVMIMAPIFGSRFWGYQPAQVVVEVHLLAGAVFRENERT